MSPFVFFMSSALYIPFSIAFSPKGTGGKKERNDRFKSSRMNVSQPQDNTLNPCSCSSGRAVGETSWGQCDAPKRCHRSQGTPANHRPALFSCTKRFSTQQAAHSLDESPRPSPAPALERRRLQALERRHHRGGHHKGMRQMAALNTDTREPVNSLSQSAKCYSEKPAAFPRWALAWGGWLPDLASS